MKALRRWVLGLVVVLALAALAIQLGGHGYIWTALRYTYLQGHNTAHIDDARNFAQAPVAAGAPQPWPAHPRLGQTALSPDTRAFLEEYRSAAFLVIHDGRLLHETYWAPYGADSRTNSFSMAKTVVTMLLAAAAADGIVGGLDEPLARWLPEYAADPRGQKATLAQFAAMTSGHDWTENYYLPLNKTTELYFGGDTAATVLGQGFEAEPGSAFEYSSASTQVLTLALARALQAREPGLTVSQYLSRRLWQPLGMEADASWSLDRSREQGGIEMGYCCLHSSARNFARLGQLLLDGGRWNGQALLPADAVARMTRPNGFVDHYGMGLWMDPKHRTPFYFLQGHLGQYVIVAPTERLIVVRLGQYRKPRPQDARPVVPDEVYRFLDEALRLRG